MNLKNFFNKILNDNRIYTREDIGAMNSNEFSENEKAIDYQLNNLGVPTNADMNSSSDVVYVHSYTRDDGTNVKAHYRSKSGSLTGAASPTDYTVGAKLQKAAAKNINLGYTFTDYYKYSLNNLKDIGSDNYSVKVKDIGDNNLKDFIKTKHKLTDDFDVIVPKVGSQLSTEVENSIELKELLKNNYKTIKNNTYKNSSIGLNFNKSTGLHLTIGKSELYNPAIDKNGNFSGLIVDFYDFDFIKSKSPTIYANNNAYRQQVNDKLKNYAIIVPINIDKYSLEKILYER